MTVVADWVTVTVPTGAGPDLRASLTDVCLSLPDSQTDATGVKLGRFGRLRFHDRPTVLVASASGVLLASLRGAAMLHDYCAAVASCGPHRVTMVHAAKDEATDPPAALQRIYSTVRTHGVQLTRKRIPPSSIKAILGPGEDGRDTGSLMFGHRARHETTLCIYDRHQDALDRGKPDPGHLLRYELRTGVDGLTLRDVCEPAPLFYHFMGAFFPRPDNVAAWAPHGEGFTLAKRIMEPVEQLRRLVESSGDIARLMRLVDQLPGEGIDTLLRVLRQRYRTHQRTLEFSAMRRGSAETAADPPG